MTAEPREIRNKRVALDAIAMLEELAEAFDSQVARDAIAAFHEKWAARGVLWTRPQQFFYDDEFDTWWPADQIAKWADVTPTTVRSWAYRGHIQAVPGDDGRPLYNLGEVIRYQGRRTRPATSPGTS